MDDYTSQRRYSDYFLPAIKETLSTYFNTTPDHITEADFNLDTTQATDLLTPDGKRIAARVRKPQQKADHYGEFTLRTSIGRDGFSEQEKVIAGKVDYLFYAFANPDNCTLDCWWLLDLKAVVLAEKEDYSCTKTPKEITGDRAQFAAYRIDGFLSIPPLVLATSETMPNVTDELSPVCRRKVASRRT